ncbi:UDP-glucose 4-epimerase family protein [Shewanella sp.]|uniref:UDP-glucose 4-epimerase family protein n=1 Tax=Shewanella sp. TaxID=50422 RepID=UPI00405422C6
MKHCLVTGSNGFLGSALTHILTQHDIKITAAVRNQNLLSPVKTVSVGDVSGETCWNTALLGVDVVLHTVARISLPTDSINSLAEFREVNTLGTMNLAKQAVTAGVKRFIFISTVKVNGESTSSNKPFTADDVHNPQDPYGVSKSEAETQLLALGQATGMEIVIIRPPLVYGPGVKANFAALLNLASKGLPLPFARFDHNRRSMVSVDNLVDLLITCIDHPNAGNQVFLVSDDHDLSTAELISKLSKACGKSGFMLPIPIIFFQLIARLIGKQKFIDRLTGSLRVDINKTKELLNWTPSQSVDVGFKIAADAFLKGKK